MLMSEQDRIMAELDQVNRRIDAHHGEYTDARLHLDDALDLLANCADISPAATTPTGGYATKPFTKALHRRGRRSTRRARPTLRHAPRPGIQADARLGQRRPRRQATRPEPRPMNRRAKV